VLPINDRLETVVIEYLPKGEALPEREALKNELTRTYEIARVAISRARPLVTEQINTVRALPIQARDHVIQVYEKNVNARNSDKSPTPLKSSDVLLAYVNTGKDLYVEGNAAIRAFVNVPLDYIRTNQKTANGAARTAADEALSKAAEFVQKFVSSSVPTTNVSEVTTTGDVSVSA
jgi:hypothetical protein